MLQKDTKSVAKKRELSFQHVSLPRHRHCRTRTQKQYSINEPWEGNATSGERERERERLRYILRQRNSIFRLERH